MIDAQHDATRASRRRKLRAWLALNAVCAVLALLVLHLTGVAFARGAADIGAPELKDEAVAAHPDVMLVGNSMLKDGVNADLLDELLRGEDALPAGSRVAAAPREGPVAFKHALGGVSSAYWTLYLKNCALPAAPKLVIIPFRDPVLTFATFRTTGPYAENIGRVSLPEEPEYGRVIARNTEGGGEVGDRILSTLRRVSPGYASREILRDDLFDLLKALPADALRGRLPSYASSVGAVLPSRAAAGADSAGGAAPDAGNPFGALDGTPGSSVFTTIDYLHFDRVVDVSFLPMMVELCRAHGVRLALLRLHKGPSPDWSDLVDAKLLDAYGRDCDAWLAAHDVIMLDTSGDDVFTEDMYRGPDHLNQAGREKLTIRLAHWLQRWWAAPDAPAAELGRAFIAGQAEPPDATVTSELREWPVVAASAVQVRKAMYRVDLPPGIAADGDTETDPERSRWELLEDGKPLGPAHEALPTIAKFGAGRYAHAGAALLFSASDGSSPRTNGRNYVLRKRVLELAADS